MLLPQVERLLHLLEQLGVLMCTWQQTDPDSPSDSFGNLTLVYSPKARLGAMLDPAHLGNEFTEEVEVLPRRISIHNPFV